MASSRSSGVEPATAAEHAAIAEIASARRHKITARESPPWFPLSDLTQILTNTQTGATGGANAIGEKDITGLAVTLTERDLLGQDTHTFQPFRQLSSNGSGGYNTATLTSSRTYDAFGEIAQQKDENNSLIDYTYNTMGKIVKQQLPTVNWTDVDGHVYSARPTTEYYYDASGRLVGTKDADGNVNTLVLVDNTGYDGTSAKVLTEYHADGGEVDNAYDAFYNLEQTTTRISGGATPASDVTVYDYDLMNRLKSVTHQARASGIASLVDYYTYDELGQRLSHYNSYLTSSVRDKTDYDAQGRVVSQTDMQNQTTTYTYQCIRTSRPRGSAPMAAGPRRRTTSPSSRRVSITARPRTTMPRAASSPRPTWAATSPTSPTTRRAWSRRAR
jgi:hypothetical protein